MKSTQIRLPRVLDYPALAFLWCLMAVAAVLILTMSYAHASPITWYLSDVTFDDGGGAGGSFRYDADTNSYDQINITTTAGTVMPGNSYPAASFSHPQRVWLVPFPDQPWTGANVLGLYFVSDLTNDGGTIQLDQTITFEGTCDLTDCAAASRLRDITTGEVTSIPEPGTAALLGMALAVLAHRTQRQRA
jgi:hypothetical protein